MHVTKESHFTPIITILSPLLEELDKFDDEDNDSYQTTEP